MGVIAGEEIPRSVMADFMPWEGEIDCFFLCWSGGVCIRGTVKEWDNYLSAHSVTVMLSREGEKLLGLREVMT